MTPEKLEEIAVVIYGKDVLPETRKLFERISSLEEENARLHKTVVQLENEAVWLSMQLGHSSVPGTTPYAKKQETRARYWREAAKKANKIE